MEPQRNFPTETTAAVLMVPPAADPADSSASFPQNLFAKPHDTLRPNFERIREAKAAIDRRREKDRKTQRHSRKARGAFTGSDEAVASAGLLVAATADTMNVYINRGGALLDRYRREECVSVSKVDLDPRGFAIWLLAMRAFWDQSTWRANRAAACALIGSIPHEETDEALALLEFGIGRQPIHQSTSSALARRMDYDHLEKIRRNARLLPQRRGQAAPWLDDWLDAGLFTGLGPDEWSLTEIERSEAAGGHFWLHVINAHSTHLGCRGSYRTLDLSRFSVEARNAVQRMAGRARQWTLAGNFAQRKSEVSRLLREASKPLLKKLYYDLESLQHQFVANMKRCHTREHISALIGELFIDDQVASDSNRRQAWRKEHIVEIPLPLEDDVMRFQKILKMFEERRALRRLPRRSD